MSTPFIRAISQRIAVGCALTILLSACQAVPFVSSKAPADEETQAAIAAESPSLDVNPATSIQTDQKTRLDIGVANTRVTPLVPPNVKIDRQSESLFAHSLAAIRAGEYAKAEILLLELTDHRSDLSGPWVNLGNVYLELGNTSQATAAFERALEANPDNCVAHNQLGVLARESGDFLAAEANYLACIQRVPGFREAYLNLGILYELYLGKFGEALQAYRSYQALLDEPDKKVKGWLMDLERRISAGGAS